MRAMNTPDRNPFEPEPSPAGEQEIRPSDARSVPAGQGLEWLRQGWQCFSAAPGLWMVITLIWVVVMVVLNVVPLFGMIAATLLAMVMVGGLMRGCRAVSRGEPLMLEHLWAGYGDCMNPLLALGGWYLAASLAIGAVALLLSALAAGLVGIALFGAFAALIAAVPALLILAVLLMAPVLMAIWFAPALVVFQRMNALDAMRESFVASLRNAPAFVVFAVVYIVLALLASIPAMLGWLILLPVTFGAIYASYRDVFQQD